MEKMQLSRRVLGEMRQFRDEKLSSPTSNWDTIWVLSGVEMLDPNEKRDGKVNETIQRLHVAIDLVRRVTAARLGRDAASITPRELYRYGPTLYFNGNLQQNKELADILQSSDVLVGNNVKKDLEGIKFRISSSQTINHTGHQFEDFPEDLASESRKVAIVTNMYHLPRCMRYLFNPELFELSTKVVPYPSDRNCVGTANAMRETKKIAKYIDEGILPAENPCF